MSTNKPYSIHALTLPDLPFLIQCVQSSKLELTINRLLFRNWPNHAAQTENYQKIGENWDDPLVERFKIVEDESGKVVGHLVLTRRNPHVAGKTKTDEVEERGKKKGEDVPEYFNKEVLNAVLESVRECHTVVKDLEHLELTHIYVRPSHRRQGIGSQMVRLAIEKAEQAGLPLFLCSEPQAHDFYLGNGFKDTGHADIDLTKWAPKYCGFGTFRLWGMIVSK